MKHSSFQSFGLSAELLRVLSEKGYGHPTPIQEEAIPAVLEGHDMLACSQTGTGKTAGFTLPLMHRLNGRSRPGERRLVRALILTPTRELAAQVGASVSTYGKYLPIKSTILFGGVSIVPQMKALRAGIDLLIATPGRLLDHVSQRTVDLSHVEFLVLDEADRMLDMGFINDIKKILSLLPKKRQNLLFSATFSNEVKKLAGPLLVSPKIIETTGSDAPNTLISQIVHPVEHKRKKELLAHLIASKNWTQVLVFTRTKHGANHLAEQLIADGISATAIHGNKSQAARTKALSDFKKGTAQVLVATDIAARGLDINQLPHVVNFELPDAPEDYVHRIGRTGRAGHQGEAISFVALHEYPLLKSIERLLKSTLDRVLIPGYEPSANEKAEPSPRGRFSRRPPMRPQRRPGGYRTRTY